MIHIHIQLEMMKGFTAPFQIDEKTFKHGCGKCDECVRKALFRITFTIYLPLPPPLPAYICQISIQMDKLRQHVPSMLIIILSITHIIVKSKVVHC